MSPEFGLRLGLTLALGTAGGAVFSALRLPLPWMLGAMTFTLFAALLRLPVVRARMLRSPFAAIVGVAIGSAFNAAALAQGTGLLLLAAATLVSVLLLSAAGFLYLSRIAGFDRTTAYFAGVPGGVYEMVHQGGLAGGDERRIALTQATRIFLVVMLVPFIVRLAVGEVDQYMRVVPAFSDYRAGDLLLLAACCLGWPLAALLRLPNAAVLGPLLVSAVVHAFGLVELPPPPLLVAAAQVVLGASIGGGFLGTPPRHILVNLGHGILLFSGSIAMVTGLAGLVAAATGLDFMTVLLSLAPGGMVEMSLIALVVSADVGVVTVLHLARIVLIHAGAPLAFRRFRPERAE